MEDVMETKELGMKEAVLEILNAVLQNFVGDSLCNLLVPIYGRIELCEVEDDINQIKSDLRVAKKGITKLVTGINIYRKFSGEGALEKLGPVDIGRMITTLLSIQSWKTYEGEEFLINPRIKMRFNFNPEEDEALILANLPSVLGDENAIRTALQETLINAIESYGPEEDGDVTISARLEGHNLVLKIADNGRGMEFGDRLKSQFPFFKVLGVKGSDRFGLGAYVALESAKSCEGDIQIESTEGLGTTAVISFQL